MCVCGYATAAFLVPLWGVVLRTDGGASADIRGVLEARVAEATVRGVSGATLGTVSKLTDLLRTLLPPPDGEGACLL